MGYKNLEGSLLYRIGQCILTAPTTAAFNGLPEAEKQFDIGKKLSFFGDGYQSQADYLGKKFWKIPIMSGDFMIEESIGAVDGIAGGNFYILGQNQAAALTAAEAAVDAISKLKGTITPFPGGVVASGSKVGSKYKFLKASTNAVFCPSLREDGVCLLPEDVTSSYEIVINGLNREAIEEAMRQGIKAACSVPGVLKITAANFGASWGHTSSAFTRSWANLPGTLSYFSPECSSCSAWLNKIERSPSAYERSADEAGSSDAWPLNARSNPKDQRTEAMVG
jgi:formylmethanofuran--tetrahydromethanopterin N-formyltransferase